jgi:hypothetical protein
LSLDEKPILVMVVIYPGAELYLNDYLESINSQVYKDFQVLVLNDHASKDNCNLFPSNSIIIDFKDNFTPAQIRQQGINFAIDNNYKYLIFTDIDDFFTNNRFYLSLKGLGIHDFVYNELVSVNSDKKILHDNLLSGMHISNIFSNYEDIIHRNFFGLSHTAVNVECLKDLVIPSKIMAVDWWIYTILLLKGKKGGFLANTKTYYRQTGKNFIGFSEGMDENRLFLGIKVKKTHYEFIYKFCVENKFKNAAICYELCLKEINELSKALKDDEFRRKYIMVINKNIDKIYNGWWSEILTLNRWRTYAT